LAIQEATLQVRQLHQVWEEAYQLKVMHKTKRQSILKWMKPTKMRGLRSDWIGRNLKMLDW
jgi:hypothetical protein